MGRTPTLRNRWSTRTRRSLVPHARSLLETVDRLHQLQTIKVAIHLDAFWYHSVHLLLHHTVDKSCHHIELIQWTVEVLGDSDRHTQCHVLYHGRERLRVVDALLMLEAFGNKARLVLLNRSIRFALDLEHPLGADRALASWQFCRTKNATKMHRLEFRLHSTSPVNLIRTVDCVLESRRFFQVRCFHCVCTCTSKCSRRRVII